MRSDFSPYPIVIAFDLMKNIKMRVIEFFVDTKVQVRRICRK